MSHWIHALARLNDVGTPAVLVTVVATRGSTPRAPGAHMIVTAAAANGTIGGGQLELRAIAIARELLLGSAQGPRLVRFPLGASVGQCCGGVVHLSFEPISAGDREWIDAACKVAQSGQAWGRMAPVGASSATTRVFRRDTCATLLDPQLVERARMLLEAGSDTAMLAGAAASGDMTTVSGAAQARAAQWLLDVCVPPELHVVLFGAGHVGRAMVDTFGRLPMRVVWVDTRDDEFLEALPDNVETRCTDTPTAEVAEAPADAVFLVLTHSHALDFELTRAILDRGDFRFFGLIGSRSKRASFERRLRARGYSDHALSSMTCPIGIAGIPGKEPEVIAIAAAAELLQLRGISVSAHPAADRRDNDEPWNGRGTSSAA